LTLFYKFLKDVKPDTLVLNGDFLDFWELSRFEKDPTLKDRLPDEFKVAHKILGSFRKILPKARIIYIEGNHSFRLKKFLMSSAPDLYGIEGISLPDFLHFKEYGIEWVGTPEGATSWQDTYVRFGELYIGHFNKVSQNSAYTAKGLVEKYGVSIIQNHVHRGGMFYKRLLNGKTLVGVENYCMCDLSPNYVSTPNWESGWSVVYTHKNSFDIVPIHVHGYSFMWNGKRYEL